MADNKVETQFTGDATDILRALQQQQRETTKLQREMLGLAKAGKTAGKETGGIFSAGTKGLSQFAQGLVGVGTAAGAVTAAGAALRSEYETLIRLQGKAEESGRTFGQAVRRTRIAFGEDDTLKDADLESTIQKVGQETRTDPKIVAEALTDAFSAKGELTNETAVDSVRQALRLIPGDAENARVLGGRAMDIAKFTGSMDARANLGFMQNVQQSSRVTSLAGVGQNLLPAIKSLKDFGDTPEQAAELTATLNQIMQDAEGAQTKTTAIALGQQLRDFVPSAKGKDDRGEFAVPQQQIDAFNAAKGVTARMEVMQGSEELRRQFLGGASFEKAGLASVESMLRGDAQAKAALAQSQKNIKPLDAGQADLFEQTVGRLDAGKFDSLAQAADAAEQNLEGARLGDTLGQRTAAARNILNQTIDETDEAGLDSFYDPGRKASFDANMAVQGTSPERAAINVLSDFRAEEKDSAFGDEAVISVLDKQIALLTRMAEAAEATAKESQKPKAPTKQKPAAAGVGR